ncbi:O-antigen polymerase [Enterococcus sp. LJL98]
MGKVIDLIKNKRNINFFNPYFLFSFIFLTIFIIYQFDWSRLTNSLDWELRIFLLFNILLFLFLGYFFENNVIENSKRIRFYEYKKSYIFLSIFILFGTLLEGVVLKGYPLFNSLGWGSIQYIEYGIPLFHVLLLTVSYFFILILFEQSIYNRKEKKIYVSMTIAIAPFVLTINRGMIVMIIISCVCLYARYNKINLNKKVVSILIVGMVFCLYVFGLFGNYRINSDYKQQRSITDSAIIMDVGEATNSFRQSFIPKEFFWFYTYVTTPLSNLQHNMDEHRKIGGKERDNFFDFIKITFLPETLSKRMNPTVISNYQVKTELTVGTSYYEIYPRYGWTGMFLYLFVISIFPFLYVSLLKKNAAEYVNIGVSLVCTMYALLFFTNFLSYTGLVFQLTFPFVLSFEKKYSIGSRFLKFIRK